MPQSPQQSTDESIQCYNVEQIRAYAASFALRVYALCSLYTALSFAVSYLLFLSAPPLLQTRAALLLLLLSHRTLTMMRNHFQYHLYLPFIFIADLLLAMLLGSLLSMVWRILPGEVLLAFFVTAQLLLWGLALYVFITQSTPLSFTCLASLLSLSIVIALAVALFGYTRFAKIGVSCSIVLLTLFSVFRETLCLQGAAEELIAEENPAVYSRMLLSCALQLSFHFWLLPIPPPNQRAPIFPIGE